MAAVFALAGAGDLRGRAAVRAGHRRLVAGGGICFDAGAPHEGQQIGHMAIPVGVAF